MEWSAITFIFACIFFNFNFTPCITIKICTINFFILARLLVPFILFLYLQAQAQECLFEKSIIDHRSNIAIAKLTEFLSVLYGQCSELIENSLSSELISASRIKVLSFLKIFQNSILGNGSFLLCKIRVIRGYIKLLPRMSSGWRYKDGFKVFFSNSFTLLYLFSAIFLWIWDRLNTN